MVTRIRKAVFSMIFIADIYPFFVGEFRRPGAQVNRRRHFRHGENVSRLRFRGCCQQGPGAGGYTSSQMAVDHLFANTKRVCEPCSKVAGFGRARPTRSPGGLKGAAGRLHMKTVRRCLPLVLHIRALPSKWASHHLAAVGQRSNVPSTTSVNTVRRTSANVSWQTLMGTPCPVRTALRRICLRCGLAGLHYASPGTPC